MATAEIFVMHSSITFYVCMCIYSLITTVFVVHIEVDTYFLCQCPCVGSVCWVRVLGPCVGSVCWVRVLGPCVGSVCWVRVLGLCVGSVCGVRVLCPFVEI